MQTISRFSCPSRLLTALVLLVPGLHGTAIAEPPPASNVLSENVASWPMKQRDMQHTGRADYVVPPERLNSAFFGIFTWQKPSRESPEGGGFSSSSMVFYDGAGPDGADLVAAGYHWPRGVQGMDRHNGRLFWSGNPSGGENIGRNSPAFSNDGSTVYVANDATESPEFPLGHPAMAFSSTVGPSTYWHNGADPNPQHLGMSSPVISADGRIFLHSWADRPYAGWDDGQTITEVWAAQTEAGEVWSDPALYDDGGSLHVVVGSGWRAVKAYDGTTGSELWSTQVDGEVQASVSIDPASGNIYVGSFDGNIWVAGLDKEGNPLWATASRRVYEYVEGSNNPQIALAAGALSHDGSTYYFQTSSVEGDGRLYAINTSDGSVKWDYSDGGRGWDTASSSPIVTPNGVIVVGNNEGDTYYAILDEGAQGTLIDAYPVNPDGHAGDGHATASATLSPDGQLYLPLRTYWIAGNGDGDVPNYRVANVFSAFDLTANAQAQIPPPSWQAAYALNHAVQIVWQPSFDPAGVFDHYALYRDTVPFSNVEGMSAIASVFDIAATGYMDDTADNGVGYYYAVTAVAQDGYEQKAVTGVGPRTPRDETDLQVVCISRTPRYPRYDPTYTYNEITEPNGFGPYIFTAATGLGSGQDSTTQRWPNPGEPVTYTATVRNRGTNPWSGTLTGTWRVDGSVADETGQSVSLTPGETVSFALLRTWDGASHEISFEIDPTDARTENNLLSINSKSVAFLSYIDRTRLEEFREETPQYPEAATDDFIDWLNLHMDRFNQMFADANCVKRVHFDVLAVLDDAAPDPPTESILYAIFPFRYRAGEGTLRGSGYYSPPDDLDFGLLHEMGHQLGLIDLYQINMAPDQNAVTHDGYSAPQCLMNGVSHFLSEHSANAMNHWADKAHGYFGQYLYSLPQNVKARFIGLNGQPLAGASVKLYQKVERPGIGTVLTGQIKAEGTTDASGEWTLPNVPIDPNLVPPTYAGDVLHDNPFGYVALIGTSGLFLFKVEKDGFADYAWLDITEVNNAYWGGQTETAVFERNMLLGGPVQLLPPEDLTELNAASWARWADQAWIELSDDTGFKQVGQGSVKIETNGGFDTYVRYPGDRLARWDLSRRVAIHVWYYADNPNGFQERSPWIRLKNQDGFFEYRTDWDILSEAIGQWVEFVIPLSGDDTWHRTEYGSPSLSNINSIELHADSWGYGFTLWMDGVSFERMAEGAPTSAGIPTKLILSQNAPNPFGSFTEVRFGVPRAGKVRLSLFDVRGRWLRDLADGSYPAGTHAVRWDGRDAQGHVAASGVYFLRLAAGGESLEEKLVLKAGPAGR